MDRGAPQTFGGSTQEMLDSAPDSHAALESALRGRTAAIGTRHGKEVPFGDALAEVGLTVVGAPVDTDALGTFTGERERRSSMPVAASTKAKLAIARTGHEIGLGSEGSFGNHPDAPFVVNVEYVHFIDRRLDLAIGEWSSTLDVCAAHTVVSEPSVSGSFLTRAGFPSHALIVRNPAAVLFVEKGITDEADLEAALRRCLRHSPNAVVGNDLRAHRNPTRQRHLAHLGSRLADRLRCPCPRCGAPGWGAVESRPGLRCAQCQRPTDLVAERRFACARRGCAAEKWTALPSEAGPARCTWCNP